MSNIFGGSSSKKNTNIMRVFYYMTTPTLYLNFSFQQKQNLKQVPAPFIINQCYSLNTTSSSLEY